MHVHVHQEGLPGHSHSHSHGYELSGRMSGMLLFAVLATLALVAGEIVAGYLGHSISLVSDAVHNLTDVPTLVISWLAARLAGRPPTPEKTYGYHRAGILAAFVNALLTGLVALYILFQSYERLQHPVEVRTGVMLWVALAALVVNGGITMGLVRGRRDLNLRSILIHTAGDALSNVAIFAGALAIRWWGANWVDPGVGLAIGALVLWTSYTILKESTHILLEGLPRHVRLKEVARGLLRIEGVREIHDIHIWTIGTNLQALSCHICIPDMHMEESEKILTHVREFLAREFHITHTTIQFERAGLPSDSGYVMPEPFRQESK